MFFFCSFIVCNALLNRRRRNPWKEHKSFKKILKYYNKLLQLSLEVWCNWFSLVRKYKILDFSLKYSLINTIDNSCTYHRTIDGIDWKPASVSVKGQKCVRRKRLKLAEISWFVCGVRRVLWRGRRVSNDRRNNS